MSMCPVDTIPQTNSSYPFRKPQTTAFYLFATMTRQQQFCLSNHPAIERRHSCHPMEVEHHQHDKEIYCPIRYRTAHLEAAHRIFRLVCENSRPSNTLHSPNALTIVPYSKLEVLQNRGLD